MNAEAFARAPIEHGDSLTRWVDFLVNIVDVDRLVRGRPVYLRYTAASFGSDAAAYARQASPAPNFWLDVFSCKAASAADLHHHRNCAA
jgi:hypothetical protein